MPELPEVEHIVRYVRPRVVGRTIERWHEPGRRTRRHAALGATIGSVERRAKLIVLRLTDGRALVFHLKLTGKLWTHPRGTPPARFARVVLGLSSGVELHFEDMRRFGWARLVDARELERLLAPLGPEPLEPGFTFARFGERLEGRRGRLKPLLLDQTFVAGIGNIYADEILFAARLHPLARAEELSARERRALYDRLRAVLRRAVRDRTDEVPDQERVGSGGRAAARRLRTREVFQRTGEPCPRCGATIARIVVQGRGTHLCPGCQRHR